MKKALSVKAEITQAALVTGAARLLREEGPEAISYRSVGDAVGVSASSTAYYFDSVNELLCLASEHNIRLWAAHAEEVSRRAHLMSPAECRQRLGELVYEALTDQPARQLLYQLARQDHAFSAEYSEESAIYERGRTSVRQSIQRMVDHAGLDLSSELFIALVAGCSVVALARRCPSGDLVQRNVDAIVRVADEMPD